MKDETKVHLGGIPGYYNYYATTHYEVLSKTYVLLTNNKDT